jgi:hypothetical protein
MVRQCKNNGVKGLISKKRGAPGNHKLQKGAKRADYTADRGQLQ